MRLPPAPGPICQALFERLRQKPSDTALDISTDIANPLDDVDFQLALWTLYELHYRSFDEVNDRWEWTPSLLTLRSALEIAFEAALREAVSTELERQSSDFRACLHSGSDDFATRFFDLVAGFNGPSMAKYVHTTASKAQIRELLMHRSIYQLKEADPHTWLIPRLSGAAKSALVELQFDEYGSGAPGCTHAELFATTLRETGLEANYGAYLDSVDASTLAVSNVISLLTLHRRHTAAGMGHLAAFEATSSLPCKRYAAGLRRVGFSDAAAAYFDEHVEADAVHEQLAVRAICANLIADDPSCEAEVFFGALCCLVLEARNSTAIMRRWESGSISKSAELVMQ